jgi:hypothetical protein
MLAVVLALEQAEGFFGGKLGDAGKVTNAEAIQNFCACEFARATAKRAFHSFVRRCRSRSHVFLVAKQLGRI